MVVRSGAELLKGTPMKSCFLLAGVAAAPALAVGCVSAAACRAKRAGRFRRLATHLE
jgi:hypothetical protein